MAVTALCHHVLAQGHCDVMLLNYLKLLHSLWPPVLECHNNNINVPSGRLSDMYLSPVSECDAAGYYKDLLLICAGVNHKPWRSALCLPAFWPLEAGTIFLLSLRILIIPSLLCLC